jgi:hypothetical protein
MERFQLVSAGRVTLAVGTPCLRSRVTLACRRDNYCPYKQFVSASMDNFSFPDSLQAFKQITTGVTFSYDRIIPRQ